RCVAAGDGGPPFAHRKGDAHHLVRATDQDEYRRRPALGLRRKVLPGAGRPPAGLGPPVYGPGAPSRRPRTGGQHPVPVLRDQRVSAITHMIDRACIGRCFSYGNYEPSSAAFRVRSTGRNEFVIANYLDSWDMRNGKYVVQDRDPPLWQVFKDDDGSFTVRRL